MKNCNEMVTSLLERRTNYETEQKKRNKIFANGAISVCSVCLAVLLGFGIARSGWFNPEPDVSAEDAIYAGMKDNFDELGGESPTDPAANNKIVINRVDTISFDRAKLNINLNLDDAVYLDEAEICEYYGVNIFPTVPDDLRCIDKGPYNIFYRDAGVGEVYWDQTVLNFDNHDFSRSVNMEVKKGSLPLLDYSFGDNAPEKSLINNWEVTVYADSSGYFSALFMYRDTGFCVNARGLTQDEFISVISSLIK